ncbi:MAG: ABC transporter ATP-binding protein [Nanoarchaeota archaeon]
MALIEFKDVAKRFGAKTVLDRISFDVKEGECVALLGRSGCGKSTLLKVLLGLYKADSGTITYSGKRIDNVALRALTGYTSQENSFYDTLTVHENIHYFASRNRVHLGEAKAKALAASVRLDHALGVLGGRLSGGMKRRLDFALSLVHDPALLVLDEPTTGLDPMLVDEFWTLIKAMQKKGKTLLVVTHHLDDVQEHCDRAVILKEGKVSHVAATTKNIHAVFARHA